MYKIIKNKNSFDVIELATENLMGTFSDHDTANKFYRELKSGKGFNGWTPSFILVKFACPSE